MQLKKIIWIVLILAIGFMLPACGGEEPAVEEEAEPIPAPTEEPTAAPTEETEPTEEPTAEEAPAEAVAAEELYQQNCAKCHGNDRNGGRGPALLPDRLTEDASVYVDIITTGSGGMPSFDDILTDEEIESLVAFVQSEPE